MRLEYNSFNFKKWTCFLLIALLLNIVTVYAITYTFKPSQSTLTISLQNQDASEFSQEQKNNTTELGFFSKQSKTEQKVEKKQPKKKPSNAQSKIVYKANIKNQSALQYPKSALRREIEGKVVLNILVDKKGTPVEVKVVTSSGFSILDNAAISSAKAWSFEPIDVKETNVDFIWVQVAIDYKIKHQNKV